MPIPKPKDGEEEKDFIGRCVRSITDEYDQNQALGICYAQLRETMSKKEKEDLFVIQPRKAENRGSYLTRCSKNNKMRQQFPIGQYYLLQQQHHLHLLLRQKYLL